MVSRFQQEFNIPIAFELDVNAAAFGEYTWIPENRNLEFWHTLPSAQELGQGS